MSELAYRIDTLQYSDQNEVLQRLVTQADLSREDRKTIVADAADLVRTLRNDARPGLMEVFLAEYGLSTDEGIALMCLAEALLRVPDADTIDALIEDKIAPSDWQSHLGRSTSSLVNASTWALMLTGSVLDDTPPGLVGHLKGAIRRLGEPVIRVAVGRAMKEMGRQFVLGENIQSAMTRATELEREGYTYSYDMLGEAARTQADADRYHAAYADAIRAIAKACTSKDVAENPGISVKLSALHPRYERAQADAAIAALVPALGALARLAKDAGMGLNVDAEEADRLSLSLQIFDAVLSDPALKGWHGLGLVVQAYGPRAGAAIDAAFAMAEKHDRRIMMRLVKGAYWDTEIKHAQVEGMPAFPVFTHKPATDVSYISNARKLLGMTDRLYPQFATHTAHTVAAILHMANDQPFEFQRLHGMGESLHKIVKDRANTRCRIYAPVGIHRDLLAYLVRRLLENGANSSFVNQIVNESVPPETVAADPFEAIDDDAPFLPTGPDLYAPDRTNSQGFDLRHLPTLEAIDAARTPFKTALWTAGPTGATTDSNAGLILRNPADPQDQVGTVRYATADEVQSAFEAAQPWNVTAVQRAKALNTAADLYEAHFGELFALLSREAGKTLMDAVAELREAVDFLRYYATQITEDPAAGIFACISPWNFPLAIFTGQIAGALAAGNAVLAKPAEQTPLIAHRATELLHAAGVPVSALQLLPGDGLTGAALTSKPVNGVAFTGSTETALKIRQNLARHAAPGTPLIAETGGLNAMIVDSTALPEQAVQAIIESAFQSAGQRCSALRCLYIQEDIADHVLTMLKGAMDCLTLGKAWDLDTDIGPVIDVEAQAQIAAYTAEAHAAGQVMHALPAPKVGTFIPPTLIRVNGIAELQREVFGPVLHVATFKAQELDQIINDINATGYGLTFGQQTRIDDRVQHISNRMRAGNVYVNRNQIGAIVGSQPFGGTGLSGTGPKAGGPDYLTRFTASLSAQPIDAWPNTTPTAALPALPETEAKRLSSQELPGPTGELNRLEHWQKPPLLCVGPGAATVEAQVKAVKAAGGQALPVTGPISAQDLTHGPDYGGVLWWGETQHGMALEQALAARQGPILPLLTGYPDRAHVSQEHHLCVDTTASGGNAALLSHAM